jgi:hypothetical protein
MIDIQDEKLYLNKGKDIKEFIKSSVKETLDQLREAGVIDMKSTELPKVITIQEALKFLKKEGYTYTATTIQRWCDRVEGLRAPNGLGAKIFLYSEKLKEYVESGTIKRKK